VALTDHVIVLDHLQQQVIVGPPTISYEESLIAAGHDPEAFRKLLRPQDLEQRVGIAGEAVTSHQALDVRRNSGLVVEVAWPCGCGVGLHVHHEFVLAAWAKHAAAEEGVDAEHLEAHAIARIEASWRPDATPRVHCRCGVHFTSENALPDPALAAWEAHVRTG
jgi:hypothetical protein